MVSDASLPGVQPLGSMSSSSTRFRYPSLRHVRHLSSDIHPRRFWHDCLVLILPCQPFIGLGDHLARRLPAAVNPRDTREHRRPQLSTYTYATLLGIIPQNRVLYHQPGTGLEMTNILSRLFTGSLPPYCLRVRERISLPHGPSGDSSLSRTWQ